MKKLFLAMIAVSFLLTSCLSGGDDNDLKVTYTYATFRYSVPADMFKVANVAIRCAYPNGNYVHELNENDSVFCDTLLISGIYETIGAGYQVYLTPKDSTQITKQDTYKFNYTVVNTFGQVLKDGTTEIIATDKREGMSSLTYDDVKSNLKALLEKFSDEQIYYYVWTLNGEGKYVVQSIN